MENKIVDILVQCEALLEGHFLLSSGKNYYSTQIRQHKYWK